MPSYKDASKKSQMESKIALLDSIGTSKDSFSKVIKNPIETAIGDFIVRVQKNINDLGLPVTGAINDITIESDGDTINIVGNPHLIFQSRGVSGTKFKRDTPHSYSDKRPPIEPIIEWIKKSNKVSINEDKFGGTVKFKELTDDEKIKKVAWAISTKIFQEGIAPKNIYEKEIPKLIEDIQKQIVDFSVQYINQQIAIEPLQGGKNRIVVK